MGRKEGKRPFGICLIHRKKASLFLLPFPQRREKGRRGSTLSPYARRAEGKKERDRRFLAR